MRDSLAGTGEDLRFDELAACPTAALLLLFFGGEGCSHRDIRRSFFSLYLGLFFVGNGVAIREAMEEHVSIWEDFQNSAGDTLG